MLTFNWNKISEAAQGSAAEYIRILDMLAYSKFPINKYDPIFRYSKLDFSGKSFLLHPKVLLYNGYKHSNKAMVFYIALASFRSLAKYKIDGTLTLDLLHSPIDPKQFLNKDRLFFIDKCKQIHFLYEEVPQES